MDNTGTETDWRGLLCNERLFFMNQYAEILRKKMSFKNESKNLKIQNKQKSCKAIRHTT